MPTMTKCTSGSTCFVVSGVLDKVLFEDAHEDGGQEAGQQQHCYTRVDDAEPVDLQAHEACQHDVGVFRQT